MNANLKTKNDQKKSKFQTRKVSNEESTIELEEEDPCAKKDIPPAEPTIITTPGLDPRFQQQNQTLRCYVMYTDFFNCEYLLGQGHEACTWFQDVYKTICPNAWIERWDEYRQENRMPWHKDGRFGEGPYYKKS